jgi:cellulose synthase/poly-beta-1,6-N-acetylglucosamine synthase-like glycosyltransferase
MAVTCGMARAGKPVMCNGANLLYTKALWQEAAPNLLAQPFAGGDDMFLLDHAFNHSKNIVYSDAPALWVSTEAPTSLSQFMRQRRRWAAKWSGYQSLWPLLVALLTVVGQLAFFGGMVGFLLDFYPNLWPLLLVKILFEGVLVHRQLTKAGVLFCRKAFLFWQIMYVPYILAVAVPSFWQRRPHTWKT